MRKRKHTREEIGFAAARWLPFFGTLDERIKYEENLQQQLLQVKHFPTEIDIPLLLISRKDYLLLRSQQKENNTIQTKQGSQTYILQSKSSCTSLFHESWTLCLNLEFPLDHSWQTLQPNMWMKPIGHSPPTIQNLTNIVPQVGLLLFISHMFSIIY